MPWQEPLEAMLALARMPPCARNRRQHARASSAASTTAELPPLEAAALEALDEGNRLNLHEGYDWSAASWVRDDCMRSVSNNGYQNQEALHEVLAHALLRPLHAAAEGGIGDPTSAAAQLAFMRNLGGVQDSRAHIRSLLVDAIDAITDSLHYSVTRLTMAKFEQVGKVMSRSKGSSISIPLGSGNEKYHTMHVGTFSVFFSGLEGIIGRPDPNLHETMRREHVASVDSQTLFKALNYETSTTSEIEWYAPSPGVPATLWSHLLPPSAISPTFSTFSGGL
jgi:hypothetical protein